MNNNGSFLEIQQLSAGYRQTTVVHNISLSVNKGEAVGILGPNGAGKSTILKAICGLLSSKQGSIHFHHHPIHALPAERIARLGLGMVPEGHPVFRELSVRDNLLVSLFPSKLSKREMEGRLDEVTAFFPILKERMEQLAGTMSGGQQQMLAIARALLLKPQLLILDEPSLGLAPLVIQELSEKIQALSQMGTTILLVEQNLSMIRACTSRVYVVQEGQIAQAGATHEIVQVQSLASQYLGAAVNEAKGDG